MLHTIAHGPKVAPNVDPPAGIEVTPFTWTVRCPRCGREAFTIEDLMAAACTPKR